MTLRSLRKIAELNLCEDCYKKYLAVLEPTIKRFLFNPLEDWQEVESLVTRMVMKQKGVFKGDLIVTSLDGDTDTFADQVDVKVFQEIKYWTFKRKVDYLGGKPISAELHKLESAEVSFGAKLQIMVCDVDDEEILDKTDIVLKVELDEWF